MNGQARLAIALLGGMAAGCAATDAALPRAADRNAVDARAILARRAPGGGRSPQTGTAVYRTVLAPTWGSRCRMLPTDSAYFDERVRACGAIPGTFSAAARLLLEVEASPLVLSPVPGSERVRWLAPAPADTCWR